MFKKIIMNPVIQLCGIIVMVAFITFMSVTEYRNIHETKQLSYMEQLAIQHIDYERNRYSGDVKKFTPWGHADIKCVVNNQFDDNMNCYPVIENYDINNKHLYAVDKGREWTPMPQTVGDLKMLTEQWSDKYGENHQIDTIEKLGVLLIAPKYQYELEHPPKGNLHD